MAAGAHKPLADWARVWLGYSTTVGHEALKVHRPQSQWIYIWWWKVGGFVHDYYWSVRHSAHPRVARTVVSWLAANEDQKNL